ncbi:MAG: histidine phosphatase family protein [Lachnospiraceae bacterium]|nr:histidine phosphatase family protein [Lachnospiraceae bacterium]
MIYLMRHGADDPDRLGGWSPYGLTDIGRQQASDAAERITNVGIAAIYSSDLPRAKETAEIVATRLRLPVTFLPAFRETNNGLLAGMLKSEAKFLYPGLYWNALEWTQRYPNGESPELFFERISQAWKTFKQENAEKTVLLVTHGGVINIIMCIEKQSPYTNRESIYKVANAEIISIE